MLMDFNFILFAADLCMTAINRLNSLQLVSVDPDTAMTSPTGRSSVSSHSH